MKGWLERQQGPASDVVVIDFAKLHSKNAQDAFSVAAALQRRYAAARMYNRRLGLQLTKDSENVGSVFVNGKLFPMDESYRHNLQSSMQLHMQYLQQMVYMDKIDDAADVENYFYDLPTTYKSRNAWIFPNENRPLRFIDLVDLEAKQDDLCKHSTSKCRAADALRTAHPYNATSQAKAMSRCLS